MGYRSGQPDILLVERKCRYMGLAIWVTSEMSKSKTKFLRRLSRQSYETIVSEDFDDLRLCFDMYMVKCDDSCKVDCYQLRLIENLNPSGDKFIRKYSPRTMSDDDAPRILSDNTALRAVVKYVTRYYPSAVLIPGLGVDGQPDLMIISPNMIHNGLAIWMSYADYCYYFSELSDNQLGFLKRMASRSYVTIASVCIVDIIRFVSEYMEDVYEYGYDLPRHNRPFFQ